MKRLSLLYLFICLSAIGMAFHCECIPLDPPQTRTDTTQKTFFTQQVDSITLAKDTVQIPAPFESTTFQGTVEVSFKIREDGTLNIVNVNANNPELIQYVITKLENVRLDPAYREIGKTIKYRFQFNKEA